MAGETKKELGKKVSALLQECDGIDGDISSRDRKRAIDYYFQRPRGDEQAGRSNVVTGDVSAMVEANLAQMLDGFSHSAIAEFDANGPEDDDQAALESFAVVKTVMQDNNGHFEIGTAVKDALMIRNGWIKVYADEQQITQTVTLENATAEAIAGLRAQPAVDVQVKEFDREAKTARIRVTKTLKKVNVEAVDPANILYPKQWHKTDVQDCPIFAERHIESRDAMIRRGFPKATVNRLKPFQHDTKIDALARDVRELPNYSHSLDKSQDLIEWYECYVLVDSGDGTSERKRVSVSGVNNTTVLEDVPVSLVGYATGSPFINPHRLTGISIYDKLKQTQDINTGLTRALMDNVNTAIKNRTAYLDGKVNVEDLSDGRPNGDIRVRASVGDVRKAITPFVQPDLSAGILSNLNYQRQVRTEMGGASLELASGQLQMAGGRIGSQGIDRAFSVMEQLASHMTKNMAVSLVRNVFLLCHAVMRETFETPVDVKRNGRWQSSIPAEWMPRTRVTVKVGMSPGERARKEQTYRAVVDAQLALAREDMDDVLVNIEGFYKALTDWGRTAELPNPEQYFVDPSSDESKRALAQKQQAAKQSADIQKSLMAQAVGLEQLRAALDKYQSDQETAFKYWSETLQAEIEEAKIVGKATADLVAQTKFGAKLNGQKENERTAAGTETDSGTD